MLVLTRKLGECIQIGENVKIMVLSVQGKSVKIGVTAPREISVYRKEVYDKIVEENRRAASCITADSANLLLDIGGLSNEKR